MREATSSAPAPVQMYQPGRVLRLHFTCRAEIPIGSFLRVTGSTLWAPGTSALDPTEATPTVDHINHLDAGHGTSQYDPYHNTNHNSGADAIASSNLYTSSVEMVTSPETYPIWKTRKPVILVWNRRGNSGSGTTPVLHHYYRYLVVAPGTVRKPYSSVSLALPSTDGTVSGGQALTTVQASTSNESTHTGSTIVMEWEDPFFTMHQNQNNDVTSAAAFGSENSSTTSLHPTSGMGKPSRNVSAVSLNSSVHLASMTNSGTQFRNLPYRTIDVHATASSSTDGTKTGSSSVILNVMDHWNNSDDPTFQPYRIRDAVRFNNRQRFPFFLIANDPI
jgi:hypothetical protein